MQPFLLTVRTVPIDISRPQKDHILGFPIIGQRRDAVRRERILLRQVREEGQSLKTTVNKETPSALNNQSAKVLVRLLDLAEDQAQ